MTHSLLTQPCTASSPKSSRPATSAMRVSRSTGLRARSVSIGLTRPTHLWVGRGTAPRLATAARGRRPAVTQSRRLVLLTVRGCQRDLRSRRPSAGAPAYLSSRPPLSGNRASLDYTPDCGAAAARRTLRMTRGIFHSVSRPRAPRAPPRCRDADSCQGRRRLAIL